MKRIELLSVALASLFGLGGCAIEQPEESTEQTASVRSVVQVEWRGDLLQGIGRASDGTPVAALRYRRGATEAALTLPVSKVSASRPLASAPAANGWREPTVDVKYPITGEFEEANVRALLTGFVERGPSTLKPATQTQAPLGGEAASMGFVCFDWAGFWTCLPDGCPYTMVRRGDTCLPDPIIRLE
jgi:hypothetical protein